MVSTGQVHSEPSTSCDDFKLSRLVHIVITCMGEIEPLDSRIVLCQADQLHALRLALRWQQGRAMNGWGE